MRTNALVDCAIRDALDATEERTDETEGQRGGDIKLHCPARVGRLGETERPEGEDLLRLPSRAPSRGRHTSNQCTSHGAPVSGAAHGQMELKTRVVGRELDVR